MKDHYRKVIDLLRLILGDSTDFDKALLLLKNANIDDVGIICEVVKEMACDKAQELHDGIRKL